MTKKDFTIRIRKPSSIMEGHLVGFDEMEDFEEATPGSFDKDETDEIFGEDLYPHESYGEKSYHEELSKMIRIRKPRKITGKGNMPVVIRINDPHTRA